jgi:hypothetical protein
MIGIIYLLRRGDVGLPGGRCAVLPNWDPARIFHLVSMRQT